MTGGEREISGIRNPRWLGNKLLEVRQDSRGCGVQNFQKNGCLTKVGIIS